MISSPDLPDWPPTFTDEAGNFSYADLPDGTYTLHIKQSGYQQETIRNVVVRGGTVDIGGVELSQGRVFLPVVRR